MPFLPWDSASSLRSSLTVGRKLFELVIFFVVAIFLGAFCAWEPEVYKGAFLSLLPRQRRARVSEVMDRSADAIADGSSAAASR